VVFVRLLYPRYGIHILYNCVRGLEHSALSRTSEYWTSTSASSECEHDFELESETGSHGMGTREIIISTRLRVTSSSQGSCCGRCQVLAVSNLSLKDRNSTLRSHRGCEDGAWRLDRRMDA
jgi:hypothetical protein